MEADASAYAALGLRPGADAVAIESAYRRLIKLNHPDRGGDPRRAAEINSAYQQLRRRFGDELGRRRGPPVPVRPQRAARRGSGVWLLALLACVAVLAVHQREALRAAFGDFALPVVRPFQTGPGIQMRAPPPVALAQAPLDSAAIDRSILDALAIAPNGGEERLARQSRTCHRQLRADPRPSRLDRCVAFDEAAVAILAGDSFGPGPFGASAVTARHLASGRLLSSDMMEVESRLSRIRMQVELSMAPADATPPAPLAAP